MKIDWIILKQSLHGGLSPEEQKNLEEWLDESPAHRELYREMKTFWADRESFRPDRERLAKLKQDYEHRLEGVSRRRKSNYFLRRVGIAASFLLLFGIGGVILHQYFGQQLQMAQEKTEILPGTQKAILVTNDGKTIQLDNDAAIVEVAGGIKIKNDTNILVYSEAEAGPADSGVNQLLIPKGGEYAVQLSDGTKVWLNSASELRYPVRFTTGERKVYLKGEAYFEVAHQAHQPFIVVTDDIEVKVYGTAFNVNTRSFDGVQTTLVRGSVSIRYGNSDEQFLKPDQMAQYNREDGRLEIRDVDVANYIGWKSGRYVFENRTIEQIMEELSLWYDVEVFFKNNLCRTQRFSGSLPRYNEIGNLLSVIEKTSHVRFEVRGRTIVVN